MSDTTSSSTTSTTSAASSASSSSVTAAGAGQVVGGGITIPDPGQTTNSSSSPLIGTSTAADESTPDYGLDAKSVMEANDGSTRTIGTALSEIDANTTKTSYLSSDGYTFSGDVTEAAFTYTPTGATEAVTETLHRAFGTLVAATADLSSDGSKYTGDVSGASFTSTDGKTTDTGAGVLQRAADNSAAITTLDTKTTSLSADGTTYSGNISQASVGETQLQDVITTDGKVISDVTEAVGGVKVQTAPADLTAAPTEADFNSLLALLKTAGVLQ